MSDITAILILCIVVVESLIIIVGNLFTIFVFWKHRNRLKRTSFLLINLTVADLLNGFTQLVLIGKFAIPQQILAISGNYFSIAASFQTAFTYSSLFSLVLISLERAYALIWPLRHRVASTKGYICGVMFVWIAGITEGGMTALALHNKISLVYWSIVLSSVTVVTLITICVSYLAIRTRLNCRVPAIDSAQNRHNGPDQNRKFSRTLFIVIAVSLVCFLPICVGYLIHILYSECVSVPIFYVFNILYLANSLVNPIIYSFRMPMFRETLKRMKLCKQSKQYIVNYKP
ncbi:somatostatin receptor type 5-like [Oculina patagonica]